ncbi:hypothetical protein WJX74_005551 [Apatococcus lobatus]|uniref:Kinesin motor domain-containing protein n=1 Tax=Apatococcus lobatus TaxID=904363 RepID=A0AAW1QBM0_9CHLO
MASQIWQTNRGCSGLIKLVGTLGTSAAPAPAEQPDISPARMALNPNNVLEINGEMLDGNAALLNLEDHDEDLLPEGVSPGPTAAVYGIRAGGNEDQDLLSASAAADIVENADPPKIRVVVRKRPLNSKEIEKGDVDIVGGGHGHSLPAK